MHLAAIVSGEAEADFDKGYAVNLDGTRHLFEAIRAQNYKPRVIFASSIAVFGTPFPEPIPDEFHLTPLTSYGTQKAIGELLLNDYTRRGFFDGIGLRLPTICVRPGKPNKAASGFFSNIIREPLKGEEAVLPVADTRAPLACEPARGGRLLPARGGDGPCRRSARAAASPCRASPATVGEQIEALRKVAGEKAAKLIRREPDPVIQKIVAGWPTHFEAKRSRDLGFKADDSFEAIVRAHIDDEHGGRAPVMG